MFLSSFHQFHNLMCVWLSFQTKEALFAALRLSFCVNYYWLLRLMTILRSVSDSTWVLVLCWVQVIEAFLMLTRLTPVATLIDTKQQSANISFSTQIATFSRHLCNRRNARVESHTHAKRTIIRKKLPAKSNIFALNKTDNTYRLFSSIIKTGRQPHL